MSGIKARYDLEQPRVLVVDDQQFMRQLLSEVLRALGVSKVRLAESAREGFAKLQEFPTDLVMVDWQMEPLDGLDLVHMIRQDPKSPNPFVPIVMMSGHTEAWRVARARDSGTSAYLAKPISAKAVYSHLVATIEDPRPFVRVGSYVDPDRRWKEDGLAEGATDQRDVGDEGEA